MHSSLQLIINHRAAWKTGVCFDWNSMAIAFFLFPFSKRNLISAEGKRNIYVYMQKVYFACDKCHEKASTFLVRMFVKYWRQSILLSFHCFVWIYQHSICLLIETDSNNDRFRNELCLTIKYTRDIHIWLVQWIKKKERKKRFRFASSSKWTRMCMYK